MYNENSLYKLFKSLKFKEDFIIIHPDLLSFHQFKVSPKRFWELIISGLGENKTFILPTFTFSKKKIWKCNHTKSESGYLTEFVRKISQKRTVHPIHSICVYGKNYKEVPNHKCASSFGKYSTWEWLCENNNVRNLSLGSEFDKGATICHYPEEKCRVFYRKYIKLNSKVYDNNNKLISKNFMFFARRKGFENNWSKCLKELKKKKIIVYSKNKFRIPIFSMSSKEITDFITEKINVNENYVI